MPNLQTLIRWQPYVPDLGSNRDEPRPFTVLLAVGLTKRDLTLLAEVRDAPLFPPRADGAPEPTDEEYAAALDKRINDLTAALTPFVKLGPEPLNVPDEKGNPEPIDSLVKLLRLYARMVAGPRAMLELITALTFFNTAGGTQALFYERLSGGFAGTTPTGRAAR